jgi:hypothetical protein
MRVVRLDRGVRVMSGLLAWLAVAAGSLLMIAVGASLVMQPRGQPFGDDPDP